MIVIHGRTPSGGFLAEFCGSMDQRRRARNWADPAKTFETRRSGGNVGDCHNCQDCRNYRDLRCRDFPILGNFGNSGDFGNPSFPPFSALSASSAVNRGSYRSTWGFLPRFIQYCWIATGLEPAYNPFLWPFLLVSKAGKRCWTFG